MFALRRFLVWLARYITFYFDSEVGLCNGLLRTFVLDRKVGRPPGGGLLVQPSLFIVGVTYYITDHSNPFFSPPDKC
jgi:hypothetical protein